MNKYANIITQVFETEAEANGINRELTFSYEDLKRAMEETSVGVCCLPDIPYVYRARRPLPESIAGHGFRGIEIEDDSERDRPVYKFAR
jgi:hypothetical protein